MTSTQFILTRHGETQWNVERRLQGHQDSPLTRRGLRQANLLAERLQHEQIDHIFSSDFTLCLGLERLFFTTGWWCSDVTTCKYTSTLKKMAGVVVVAITITIVAVLDYNLECI